VCAGVPYREPRPRASAFSADPVPDRPSGAAVPIGEANEYFEREDQVRIENFSFGSIQIDGRTYAHDVVIDRGQIRKRRKGASKRHRDSYGHTPLSAEEKIPWRCRRLVIGTGAAGALPVMGSVQAEARRRDVELVTVPTKRAIDLLATNAKDTNAILHITC
jgi:hypothetical protein